MSGLRISWPRLRLFFARHARHLRTTSVDLY
jgi:hypothetical protein